MTWIDRRHFLKISTTTLLSSSCIALKGNSATPKKQPNIIFLFADDLGWGDLGCYGHSRLKTPNLDRLAQQGTLFTQFYVSGSVCSPSRTAIMTGHFPARHGIHGHLATEEQNQKRGMPNYLDPSIMTITRQFQQAGYVTGHFGKWHLGHGKEAPLPSEYGIDSHRTNTSNDKDALTDFNLWAPQNRPVATKKVLDETLAFIQNNKEKPFYINAWFVDPHATLNPSEEQMEPYRKLGPQGVSHRAAAEIYYGTVTEMDKQIGLFLDALEKMGLAENTVILFSSDNGPEEIEIGNASHSGVGSPGPFRGRKRSIYEGGIRVPFIVRWPGHVPAGRIDTESVIGGVDFFPTLCALAGLNIAEELRLDGEDRSHCLLGDSTPRKKPLMWEWRYRIFGHVWNKSPMLAIRDGQWKLLMNPDRSRIELYDIPNDPTEMNNVAETHPDIAARMSEAVLQWQKELPVSPYDPGAGSNAYPWPG